jgi:heme/copper-type cytochrome/quinol oxidase subunit 2
MRTRLVTIFATLAASVLSLVSVAAKVNGQPSDGLRSVPSVVEGQDQGGTREFTVLGSHYAYNPPELRVSRNDLVKVTFTAGDIAHSFTIDDYRISKRAAAGQSVTFEFRADRPGTFTYYCNLSLDDGCRNMKGRLVVQ